MAHHFIFAEKDTTLIRGNDIEGTGSAKNLGADEILEVGKNFQENSNAFNSIARSLIYFNISELSSSVVDGSIPRNAKFYLNLYDAGAVELDSDITMEAYAVSQSWLEGTGKFTDFPQSTNGASWKYRNASTASAWASANSSLGGTFYEESSSSYTFNKNTKIDPRFDVTEIVNGWITGSFDNENSGFLLKRSSAEETSTSASGMFKFFSSDTHTVFPPKLEAVWDDATWSTGSLSPLTSTQLDSLKITVKNLKHEYKRGSLEKIRVCGRELYPAKTFSTTSSYLDVATLPSASSFFSIVDDKTADVIVPFGTGSKLSCDSEGNFFKLRTAGLQPERFYKIQFLVESGSGINKTTQYVDDDHQFKVVR